MNKLIDMHTHTNYSDGEYSPKELKLPSTIVRRITEPSNMITMIPSVDGTDGFFVATMERSNL